jgi:hypothetical protein
MDILRPDLVDVIGSTLETLGIGLAAVELVEEKGYGGGPGLVLARVLGVNGVTLAIELRS